MFEEDKVLSPSKQTELEDVVGYCMFKAMVDFDFSKGEPKFTVDMIKVVKAEETKRTGKQNKPLPLERLKSKNPELF